SAHRPVPPADHHRGGRGDAVEPRRRLSLVLSRWRHRRGDRAAANHRLPARLLLCPPAWAACRQASRRHGAHPMNELLIYLLWPFQFPFMTNAMIIAVMVAIPTALLSCFLVLKGWSLMGDAISHAVLPGVV